MYQPNFNDPRVQRKCQRAFEWTVNNLGKKPQAKSQKEIKDHFGQGQKPLTKWLRSQLLICTDQYFNRLTGQCKRYIANPSGIKQLKQLLNGPITIKPELQAQLDTGLIEYRHQSNRFWNPLQNLPSYIKRPTLAQNGFNYNYDIQCCAQTLLLQYARKCGLDRPTPRLDEYIANRTHIRQQLAQELSITPDQVKKLLTALLNGARLAHRDHKGLASPLLLLLDNKSAIIDQLKSNSYVSELRKEIKLLWSVIKPHRSVRTITLASGKTRSCSLSPRDKAEIYRELEERVIRSVQTYLKRDNNKSLLQHDGWTCERAIDINELRTYVKTHSGYVIELDWEIWQ